MNGNFIKHSHGVNSRDFLRGIGTLLHALDSITTFVNSCLYQKSKIVLILRINLSPDGQAFFNTIILGP